MAKGILYVMTTVVPGLIKIGKTGSSNFEQRMQILEHNGYSNVTGLKRRFAIEVEDYDEKEVMLDSILSRCNIDGTELFAMDVSLAVQLLSSFDGDVVYPKTETKDKIFDDATEDIDRLKDDMPSSGKAKRFKFSLIDIRPGEQIAFLNDPSKKAMVLDDTYVVYEGKKWSTSRLAMALGHFHSPVQGPAYFTYKGEKLTDIRSRKECGNEGN